MPIEIGLWKLGPKLEAVRFEKIEVEKKLEDALYGGNLRIRTEASLRQSALIILDYLVAAGSSVAYKLRDDFLTPFVN